MAIEEINQKWAMESVSQDSEGHVEYTLGYQVISDTVIEDSLSLLLDPSVPFFGALHPLYPTLVVVGRRVSRIEESRTVADLEITYSSKFKSAEKKGDSNSGNSPEDSSSSDDDPLNEDPVIEWVGVEGTKVAEFGLLRDNDTGIFEDGFRKVTNSAGQPYFDPPVEIRASQWQVMYRVNETSPNPAILGYIDVVNSDSFTIGGIDIEPGQALMAPARISTEQFQGGKYYVSITYDIRLRPKLDRVGDLTLQGWEVELQDRGFHYLDDEGDLVRATDDEGNEMTEPVFLDGEGGLAADPESSPARIYKVYPEKPFSIFGFK